MDNNKIFTPHELKTIEVDVEKKIFRVNGEDFGKGCSGFSISCNAEDHDKWFDIQMRTFGEVLFHSTYDIDGNKTSGKVNGKAE